MSYAVKVVAGICTLIISQTALACNREALELPYDFDWADTVLVGRVNIYRIVPNEAEGERLTQAVKSGTASEWQRQEFESRMSKGLPLGGSYGLFDVTVTDVLKGKSDRRITVIYPDVDACCFGPGRHSMLPASLRDQDAVLGLEDPEAQSNSYYGRKLPRLFVDPCTSAMLFAKDSRIINDARKHFRSKRKEIISAKGRK